MTKIASIRPAVDASEPSPESESRPHPGWFVVAQVKSNRVVYFTDDPEYQPPMKGDWYFISHYLGDLPPEMTLRNCWGWRFNGGVFTDAREPEPLPPLESLLESNRSALLTLLRDKIDAVRATLAPSCVLGNEVRQRKLMEAHRFRTATTSDGQAPTGLAMLEAVAVARNIPLQEAASLIEVRHQDTQRMLEITERIRERYTQAIFRARTQEEMIRLRQELLKDVLPELSKNLAFPATTFEPEDWQKPLSDFHRAHEIARLQVQLREFVNAQRAHLNSQYLEDDTLVRHKMQLAQAVLSSGGAKPPGVDCSLLENYAQAHRLSLVDAARLVLGAANEAEQILLRTEMIKDTMLAKIETITNLRDVKTVGLELEALATGKRPETT